jgi:S-ribosylhomocysteine lyase
MELIASFQVDHTRIVPGIYVSRTDDIGGDAATTFDVRMKRPNVDAPIAPDALHTIEHVVATFLRNDPEWKDRIVYWGPMGCLTGNYLIVKGRPTPQDVYPLILRAFDFLRDYSDDVPGATAVACGNFRLHNLPQAKREAAAFAAILRDAPSFDYPLSARPRTRAGDVFFDS